MYHPKCTTVSEKRSGGRRSRVACRHFQHATKVREMALQFAEPIFFLLGSEIFDDMHALPEEGVITVWVEACRRLAEVWKAETAGETTKRGTADRANRAGMLRRERAG